MEKSFILKGDICYSKNPVALDCTEQGYLVCVNGLSEGVYRQLPERFAQLPITDCGSCLILPGLTDLHVHAPQYAFRGLGMDLELLDWLNTRTFPEEAKYADPDYALTAYTAFVDDLKRGPNTRACVFATVHVPATVRLMELLEQSGLVTMVGKVNMDRNSIPALGEDTGCSLRDTQAWLKGCAGRYQNTTPILTPRFVPACTDELMRGLGELQSRYRLPVQSHLSENPSEVAWVKELCPEATCYGDAYRRFGLFGGDAPTVMAHCVWTTDQEARLIRESGVYVAHCPQSNTNLTSGIAPVRRYLDTGISVGLGSDMAGGCHSSIFRAMSDAIQVSKLRRRLVDPKEAPLSVEEAFYLGTAGGGGFFGNVGSFAPGYELDALVIDDAPLAAPFPLSIPDRLARVIYLSDDRHIRAKYVRGRALCLAQSFSSRK